MSAPLRNYVSGKRLNAGNYLSADSHLLDSEHRLDRGGIGVDQRGSAPIFLGQPVIGQMQVDPGRLDRQMPSLGLHRLQRHPGLTQPGQTRVPQLMARRMV